ncbi:MAG: DUF1802 family protein [Chthoniobacterales bacterium]|nr:DUF1802 family protein [Chthoniobacterales bacterium]
MLSSAHHRVEPVAFKEWALVCEALGSGDQSLLLRKGGLAEGKEGFGFEHSEFFLFPTWFHGQIEKIRTHRASAVLQEAPEVLNLEYMASIEWNDFITDRNKLTRLASFHILEESVIEERFNYIDKHQKNIPGIHVAFVRVYRLDVPLQLTMEKRFGGCRSWIQLPKVTIGTSVSVLSDEEHGKRRIILEKALA